MLTLNITMPSGDEKRKGTAVDKGDREIGF